jgi:hypothetical protein
MIYLIAVAISYSTVAIAYFVTTHVCHPYHSLLLVDQPAIQGALLEIQSVPVSDINPPLPPCSKLSTPI